MNGNDPGDPARSWGRGSLKKGRKQHKGKKGRWKREKNFELLVEKILCFSSYITSWFVCLWSKQFKMAKKKSVIQSQWMAHLSQEKGVPSWILIVKGGSGPHLPSPKSASGTNPIRNRNYLIFLPYQVIRHCYRQLNSDEEETEERVRQLFTYEGKHFLYMLQLFYQLHLFSKEAIDNQVKIDKAVITPVLNFQGAVVVFYLPLNFKNSVISSYIFY